MTAYLHAIGTAVPGHDVHDAFIAWARAQVDDRTRKLFDRMAARAGIAHRWSILPVAPDGGSPVAAGGFYDADPLPGTGARMQVYAQAAPALALDAIAALGKQAALDGITHLVVASCTGFVAPGVDQIIAARLGLSASVERLLVGFMGCYAAVAALRQARHIVRSDPQARVLVVTVELSTLHLQPATAIEPLLAMLQFGDGAAAALVTATPGGFALDRPFAAALPDSGELIRWDITDRGFAMHLSGEVPARIAAALSDRALADAMTSGIAPGDIDGWAVHAGGRSILDAVEHALGLGPQALSASRDVLTDFGNMSSATLMFVLARLLAGPPVTHGVALAFGPGLAAEGFRIRERLMERAVDVEELMDADDLDAATFRDVLTDLDRANGYSLGYRPTLAFLDRLVARHRPATLRILDVGSGSGWMLKEIDRWQIGRGIAIGMTGIDLNPRSEPIASLTTSRDAPIDYRTGDYADLAGQEWDVIISSLVVHHMTQPQLIAFLRFMETNARLGWFVNDLRRSRVSQCLYGAAASVMGLHPIVRHDGRLSIARSYTPAEWPPLLAEAGIADARVFRAFPFRLCVQHLR